MASFAVARVTEFDKNAVCDFQFSETELLLSAPMPLKHHPCPFFLQRSGITSVHFKKWCTQMILRQPSVTGCLSEKMFLRVRQHLVSSDHNMLKCLWVGVNPRGEDPPISQKENLFGRADSHRFGHHQLTAFKDSVGCSDGLK